jgi:hypothetical protein
LELLKHEIASWIAAFIITMMVEEVLPEAVSIDELKKLPGHNLVRVHIAHVNGNNQAFEYNEFLHDFTSCCADRSDVR